MYDQTGNLWKIGNFDTPHAKSHPYYPSSGHTWGRTVTSVKFHVPATGVDIWFCSTIFPTQCSSTPFQPGRFGLEFIKQKCSRSKSEYIQRVCLENGNKEGKFCKLKEVGRTWKQKQAQLKAVEKKYRWPLKRYKPFASDEVRLP